MAKPETWEKIHIHSASRLAFPHVTPVQLKHTVVRNKFRTTATAK